MHKPRLIAEPQDALPYVNPRDHEHVRALCEYLHANNLRVAFAPAHVAYFIEDQDNYTDLELIAFGEEKPLREIENHWRKLMNEGARGLGVGALASFVSIDYMLKRNTSTDTDIQSWILYPTAVREQPKGKYESVDVDSISTLAARVNLLTMTNTVIERTYGKLEPVLRARR